MSRLATWVLARLTEHDERGAPLPPGARAGGRALEPDGRELAVVGRGDGLDVYFCGARDVVAFACSARTARRLAWIIVWRWWVRGTWCGLKLVLWRWAVRARLEQRPPARGLSPVRAADG